MYTGKLLVIDEAHKFMDGVSTDGLSNAIVNIARLMRHEGIRLVVSTQSPKALAPELLELSSICIMHGFSSRDWFDHLKSKLPLSPDAFNRIMELGRGEALIHVKKHKIGDDHTEHHNLYGTNVFSIFIRPRVTRDLGGSIVNIHSK
jgi:DNA helicase HerA-like ATPase